MVLPFIKISISIRSIFLATLFINCHDIAATSQPPAPQGFAVVELFTSEGCSSCPPADAAMSVIANKYKEQVFVLGFHVDYWNRLGWKDEFSSSDYSKRQRNYATAFSLEGVYTPQVVVNGKSQFVGSDKSKIEKVIQSQLNEKAAT
ncbi:MAG: DUF1223 domain-containing protein, partial [Ferruginibacter sp.]